MVSNPLLFIHCNDDQRISSRHSFMHSFIVGSAMLASIHVLHGMESSDSRMRFQACLFCGDYSSTCCNLLLSPMRCKISRAHFVAPNCIASELLLQEGYKKKKRKRFSSANLYSEAAFTLLLFRKEIDQPKSTDCLCYGRYDSIL